MSARRIDVLHVVGARPNFMKIAPIMAEMARRPERFRQRLVHTGQHYDARMSRVFFDELGLPRPDVDLGVGSGSHAVQTAEVMLRFEPIVAAEPPDWVVVVGDVNSTLACALVTAKRGIRTAHVEAGLRSYDRTMPEELNRLVTDQLSDLLLAPSPDAVDNLAREGIPPERVRLVGNAMIDTLLRLRPAAEARWSGLAARLGLEAGAFVLATLHRPSNVDDARALAEMAAALAELGARVPVVVPLHPRTQTRLAAEGLAFEAPGVRLLEPLGYLDFLALEARAGAVLTDSGGVQEETTVLGVPCVTARPNTERPITVTEGTNRLVATERGALVAAVREALGIRDRRPRPPALWDGRAAERIVAALDA